MKLVVGLGNPGPKYAGTRHNVGFEVITMLAGQYHMKAKRSQHNSLIAHGNISEQRVVLQQPLTFMNRSGVAVKAMAAELGLVPEDILVIVDDLDLPLGRIRIRANGGSGGHNGLKSITEALGSSDFPRLRIGIGRPSDDMAVEDYVLEVFSKEEREIVKPALETAVLAVETYLLLGATEAANRYNAG
jgi:PTH1 family peptidyl-tRNA hydrolase